MPTPSSKVPARASADPVASPVANDEPPPPIVIDAMAGEPGPTALAEARLVTSSCADDKARTDAAVARMRAEVRAELETWRNEQPHCWEMYRDIANGGGLGLTGVGEGGGGYGEGIGLGSIGTIGHGGPRPAKSVSKTNVQVEGVDEPDIVKTDGRWVYLARNGALRIVEATNPRVVSITKLGGDVRDLFVEGDRAVVYTSSGLRTKRCTYGYDCVFSGDGSSTKILVIDLASRERPKVVRTIELSGSLLAARRIGKAVHTVVADGDSGARPLYETWPRDLPTCGTMEATVRKKFAALEAENERAIRSAIVMPSMRDHGAPVELCRGLYRTRFEDGLAFTTVVSFALDDDATPPVTATIQSRPGAVFASANALYLAVAHQRTPRDAWFSFYPNESEASEVHKLRIGAKPSETRYVGSGVVPGHVLNQFAMDEWGGALRVATSIGRVPDPNVKSSVSILAEAREGNLVRVGAVDGLAPGEDIRAVRFDDDRGYVVTFKKTDPLFVIDLRDAAHPKTLGELKIPGFSTYLHRIDKEHLLAIGFDANDHGDFAYFDGLLLQLFDVKNATEPKLLFREKIGSRGSTSEAATNHLAFNYLADRGLLAIPITECRGGGDGTFGETLAFSGLYVYDVSVERGFRRLGGVDHGKQDAPCSSWWSSPSTRVERSLFLDDLVYSIAPDRVKVQRLGAFGHDVADLAMVP